MKTRSKEDSDSDYYPTETTSYSDNDESESDHTDHKRKKDKFRIDINKGLPKRIDKDLGEGFSKNFNSVIKYIKGESPDLIKIIQTPLRIEDKARLLELYEVFKKIRPCTVEWLDTKNEIIRKFRAAKREYVCLSTKRRKEIQKKKRYLETTRASKNMEDTILQLETSDTIKSYILQEYQHMTEMSIRSEEYDKVKLWLQFVISLPFDRVLPLSDDNRERFLLNARDKINRELYGLERVKESLLVFINAKLVNPTMKECCLGLVGPVGVGKTRIVTLLSEILGLPFSQIQCGGLADISVLKGNSTVYIGSKPGEIVSSLIMMKCKNGILFFDEFEKTSGSSKINSFFLHLVDPNQNKRFVDSFIGLNIPIDLSCVWFIFSMNSRPEDVALTDRIFFIEIEGYNFTEKMIIARNYSLPRLLKNAGLNEDDIVMSEDVSSYLVHKFSNSYEKGIRTINHALTDLVRKVLFLKTSSIKTSFWIEDFKIPLHLTSKIIDTLSIECKSDEYYKSMYL